MYYPIPCFPADFPLSLSFSGGQAGLQSIWDKYYDESHAVIYVVDSANEVRGKRGRYGNGGGTDEIQGMDPEGVRHLILKA